MKTMIIGIMLCIMAWIAPAMADSNHAIVSPCVLSDLKTNKILTNALKFSSDPAGLAIEAKSDNTDAVSLFQTYANTHHCTLYMLSMLDLIQGLFKGSSDLFTQTKSTSSQSSPDNEMQNMGKKFLLISGDRAVCIQKLGLKLPFKMIHPNLSQKGAKQ